MFKIYITFFSQKFLCQKYVLSSVIEIQKQYIHVAYTQ
jgi:hypothetical protein